MINKHIFSLGLTLILAHSFLWADDTEVFITTDPIAPNVLFLLDNSGSMRSRVADDTQRRTRIQVLKDSLGVVLENMDANINIGLARFSGARNTTERGISFPVSPITANATTILTTLNARGTPPFNLNKDNLPNPSSPTLSVKSYLQEIVNSWNASNYTPLVGSMTEAMQYYKGQEPIYGYAAPTKSRAAHPSTYQGMPIKRQFSAIRTRYKSPIVNACQSNYLVLLSDGRPYDRLATISNRQDRVLSLLGLNRCRSISNANISTTEYNYGKCGYELAEHMATQDLLPAMAGKQHVKTYTIGFGVQYNQTAQEYLKILANAGQGEFYIANSAAELAKTFNDLLNTLAEKAEIAFASPSYSVNTKNGLAHDKQIYIPIVTPQKNKPRWSGNVKKFELTNGNIVNQSGQLLTDSNHNINPKINDLWQTNAANSASSGMASLLVPHRRKLLTHLSGTNLTEIKINNPNISQTLLKATTTRHREQLLDYIRGYNISPTSTDNCTQATNTGLIDTGFCEKRQEIGDILHSQPVLVSYDDTDPTKRYLFFGTNEGFLHAVNAETGQEAFAFMPKELLKNIDTLFQNTTDTPHPYGVDGKITVWKEDKNADGKIVPADGDHLYLYFGLRRGGRSYFALDVTQPTQPALLWHLQGGTGQFTELGQTWSKPTLAKINNQLIMVVGGGYDPSNGDEQTRVLRNQTNGQENHTQGRAIYLIDAKNGTLLKSISYQDDNRMTYSITGDIRLLDMNGDTQLDRLYFADTGGQLWRVDLFANPQDQTDITQAQLTLLATLGEDTYGSDNDSRKFFVEPEVSVYRDFGKDSLFIAIGSGYLAHPLSKTIIDRIYIIKDPSYTLPPNDFIAIKPQDLANAGLNVASTVRGNPKGWYLNLNNNGEKILSSPYVFLNKVFFTTFTPNTLSTLSTMNNTTQCNQTVNHTTKLYALSLFDGSATIDLNGDGQKDKSIEIKENFIPKTPILTFEQPVCSTNKACNQVINLKVGIGQPILRSQNNNRSTRRKNSRQPLNINNFDINGLLPKIYWINHNKF